MGLADRIWNKATKQEVSFFKENLLNLIKKITQINTQCRVLVFGSISSNEATSDSDIDIAVILHDSINKKEFIKQYYTSEVKLNTPVDIVFRNESEFKNKTADNLIDQIILSNGKEIYPQWNLND